MNARMTGAARLDATSLRLVDDFGSALVRALTGEAAQVSPKWFYDREGSELFDRICDTPEYYPTRTETAMLEDIGAELSREAAPDQPIEIVEFGAGAMQKIRVLARGLGRPFRYLPVDISGEFLRDCATSLARECPAIDVEPIVADLTRPIDLPPMQPGARRIGFYAGSSIGNFAQQEAAALMRRMGEALAIGSGSRATAKAGPGATVTASPLLLIGVDLVKDPARLHAAYNDAAGVTAAFNLNLLARANRELDADFDLEQWAHSAFYNAPHQRIEMHLMSLARQQVRIAGRSLPIEEGATICTEHSHKYTPDRFRRLAADAGWAPERVWFDAQRLFSVHLMRW